MKQISKKQYDLAILTVKSYAYQVEELAASDEEHIVKPPKKKFIAFNNTNSIPADSKFNLDNVKTGDFLMAAKTNSKLISEGALYEVFDGLGSAIKLKDNKGKLKYLSRDNKFRLWSVVVKL